MTDLPEDDKQTKRRQRAFNQLVALKAQKQAEKKHNLIDWKIWYQSLDDNERAIVDERLAQHYDRITARFGKGRRYRPPER